MKIQNALLLNALVVVLCCATQSHTAVSVRVSATFSELGDYGEWTSVPGYGTVWRPYADPDWRPFMYGQWVYTTSGWVWDSDEPFGWIVCHYGNWYYDEGQGWVWLPGYDWSPARVRWYVTADEIGWAPLFPRPLSGYPYHAASMQWTFCPTQYFASNGAQSHTVIRTHSQRQKSPVRAYTTPPRRELVQRAGGAPITSVRVNKVRVATHAKPLVKARLPSQQHQRAAAPVGQQYRKTVAPGESNSRQNPSVGTVQQNPSAGKTDQREMSGENNSRNKRGRGNR